MDRGKRRIPVGPPPGGRKGGLGEVGVDYEAQGMGNYYQPEPQRLPEYSGEQKPFKPVDRPLPPGPPIREVDQQPYQVNVPKPFKWGIIRVVQVGNTRTSLVQSRGNRVEVSLHNLGDDGLWFNFTRDVAQGNGEFIPGSPTAGARLGGFWSQVLSDEVEIWGIVETGGNPIQVAVAEFGL